jgi:hypothetical protein
MSSVNPIRIATGDDKKTVESRTQRASIVATMGPKSALYNTPAVKTAIDAVAAQGVTLAAANEQVKTDDAQAIKSRAARDGIVLVFDAAYDVGVATVEQNATKLSDVTDTGFESFTRTKYAVEAPLSLLVTFDGTKELIDIDVKHAAGMHAAFVEYTADPISPTSVWKRIDGIAAEYHLPAFPPGRYWFHACAVRGADLSAFTLPVSVVVK